MEYVHLIKTPATDLNALAPIRSLETCVKLMLMNVLFWVCSRSSLLVNVIHGTFITEPCLFGGSCTNTRGFFSCTCPPDRRGHRCQYQILCDDDTRCDDGETCVETLANVNGFVCDSTQPNETLTIQLNGDVTDDILSEAVYIVVS